MSMADMVAAYLAIGIGCLIFIPLLVRAMWTAHKLSHGGRSQMMEHVHRQLELIVDGQRFVIDIGRIDKDQMNTIDEAMTAVKASRQKTPSETAPRQARVAAG